MGVAATLPELSEWALLLLFMISFLFITVSLLAFPVDSPIFRIPFLFIQSGHYKMCFV